MATTPDDILLNTAATIERYVADVSPRDFFGGTEE